MQKHLLLIDSHALGYAAQQATKLTVGGREVQAIYGVVNRVREMVHRFNGATPIMLWDGTSKWRHELYPEYKAQRSADPKMVKMRAAFRQQKPDIKRAMDLLGISNVYSESSEADDLAGYFAREWSAAGHKVTLVTGDRDWIQLVRPGVCWLNIQKDNFIHHDTLLDKTGFKTPLAFLQGKALEGDTSDNISGAGGIGEQGAPELLAQYGNVTNLLTLTPKLNVAMVESKKPVVVDGVKLKRAWAKLAINYKGEGETEGALDRFKRNLKLMNLIQAPRPTDLTFTTPKLNADGYKAFCEELHFQSHLRELGHWLKPFHKEQT